jgi:hypothetical protein
MKADSITILGLKDTGVASGMLRGYPRVTLTGWLCRVFRNILRETEAECIARI